tara:strand:- start:1681 stop:2547 length:867 start_codon:yes stop_codon:yes gene_type:complete
MKILIFDNIHHKNKESLIKILNHLKYEYLICNANNYDKIKEYDIIYSPGLPIDTSNSPNKKFIFGPHFSVFPNNKLSYINNIHSNSVYIQPSEWATNVWKLFNIKNIIPLKTFHFSVNTERFNSSLKRKERTKVFIYFKRRKSDELRFIETFLKNNNIEYIIFDYIKRYDEEDYLKYLQESKYGIILDAHESQGFAIEEALSCDVPLLVWNVTSMKQEHGSRYKDISATSIPYWDERCGEYFFKENEFEDKFNEFISKLDTYKPREYVLENLSVEKCAEKWNEMINKL